MKKIFVVALSVLLIFSSCLFFSSCGCSDDDYYDPNNNTVSLDLSTFFDESLPAGSLEFTYSIMDLEDFDRIMPLGNLSLPGHPIPTDHIYFVIKNVGSPVYAPAGGKVLYVGETSTYGDSDIRIAVTNTMSYYLGHIFVDEDLQVGDTVEAGNQIGMSGNTSCVDFGAINKNINNVFINQHYPAVTLYGDKPLTYYAEPLRFQLYGLVKPALPEGEPDYVYDGGVTDGEFVFDQAGTLLGNWFVEGSYDSQWYEWSDLLAFAYDNYYTNQIRIAVGANGNYYALKNEDNPTKPENVSVASGVVTYYLYNANNAKKGLPTGNPMGVMIVQMLSDSRIKLEVFDNTTSGSFAFTNAALYYVR